MIDALKRAVRHGARTMWTQLSDGCDHLLAAAERTARRGWNWFTDDTHALHGLAVARMLIGLAVLGETLSNFSTRGYSYGATWTGQYDTPSTDFVTFPPYNVLWAIAGHHVGLTSICVIVAGAAAALAAGVLTRTAIITLLIFWVALSEITPFTADQSDNLIRIALTLLLFTRCGNTWALLPGRRGTSRTSMVRAALHNGALLALGAQVCFIYAAGGLYKAGGQPWAQGWAIYDPLHVKQFSTWPELANLITTWGPGVALATTLTVLVQTAFPVLLLRPWTRRIALIIILGFHIGIGVLMGLPWFSVSALAIDAVFIRETTWKRIASGIRSFRPAPSHLPASAASLVKQPALKESDEHDTAHAA